MQTTDLILSATVLRARGNYKEAIILLETNLQRIMDEDPDYLLNAYKLHRIIYGGLRWKK